MSERPRAPRAGVPGPTVRFVLLSLLSLCILLPPETRGESAAGCALLVLLLTLLTFRDVGPNAAATLALGLALAWPAALLSLAPGISLPAIATLLLAGAAGICAAARADDLRATAALPTALAIAATLVSLHALYQVLHGLDAMAQGVEAAAALPDRDLVLARLHAGRAFAAFVTPAALGGMLAISLPVTAAFAAELAGRRRILAIAAVVLQAGALAASASASAAGALLAALLLHGVRRAGGKRALVLAAGGVAVVLAAVIALRGSSLVDPTQPESPWKLRAGNVHAAAAMALDHPWTGVGAGAFGEAYPRYRRAGDNESRHAHDLPAEWVAEHGFLLGGLLAVAFFALFLAPVIRRAGPGPPWIAGARVGLAALALHNLVDFTASFPSFLVTAAILRAACAQPEARVARARGLVRLAPVAVALAAGAVVALSGLAWNARIAVRTEAAVAPDGAGLDLQALEAGSARAVRLAPWDPDARMMRAEALLRAAASSPEPARAPLWSEALANAEAAVRQTPERASARAMRARVRVALGDLPGAFADLDEAARLYPMKQEYARDRRTLAERLPDSSRAQVLR